MAAARNACSAPDCAARNRHVRGLTPCRSPADSSGLDAVLEALSLWQRLELLQRVVLDLPDPLAGDAERTPHLLERTRLLALEPEAQLDHLPLALRQRRERVLDVLAPERELGSVVRRLRSLVLHEVPERRLLLLA